MKKLLPLVVLVLGIALAGCLPTNEDGTSSLSLPGTKKTESYTFKMLKKAVELGIPLKCTYKVDDVEVTGYMKGKKWRGKISMMGKTGDVIMKDNCMWSWAEGQGVKMCFDEDMWEMDEQQQATPDVEYVCVPAVISDSEFNPPSNIQFMEM